jgi:hypothetical protein
MNNEPDMRSFLLNTLLL